MAEGIIKPEMGVTKNTPGRIKCHCTWWMCKNVIPENDFTIIP